MKKERYSEQNLAKLSCSNFLRLMGVDRVTFDAMVHVIQKKCLRFMMVKKEEKQNLVQEKWL